MLIPKKNGKLRPLGLPSWSDKLAGEVVRLLLEAYYEPQFSDRSHGFRKGRGCHTALREIQQTWTGTVWFIEGDISDCFGSFSHDILLGILAEKIRDNRFLRRQTRNMLTQLGEWTRLGFFTRTGFGTYKLNTPTSDTPSTTRPILNFAALDHVVTPQAPLTGSGWREHSYGGFGGDTRTSTRIPPFGNGPRCKSARLLHYPTAGPCALTSQQCWWSSWGRHRSRVAASLTGWPPTQRFCLGRG